MCLWVCHDGTTTHHTKALHTPATHWCQIVVQITSGVVTQNSENDLFNPNITSCISFNKYIKLINIFVLGRHLLRQDIVAGTDGTVAYDATPQHM